MEEKKTKKNIIMLIIIVTIILLVAGVTYAYFSLYVRGNDTSSKNVIKSGDLEITLDGTSVMQSTDLEPGDTITKTFTVKNTGTGNISTYNVYFSELVNSYTKSELVYTLTCSASSGSCNGVSQTPVGTDYSSPIVTNSIAVNVTQTYTLTVTFIETSSNQNYNKDQTISFVINVNNTNHAPASDYLTANYSTLGITKIDRESTGNQNYNTTEYRYQGNASYAVCSGVTKMTEPICDTMSGDYYYNEGYPSCNVSGNYYYNGEMLNETNCQTYGGTYNEYPEPNNYVTFNNESWRIVGIFETDNALGEREYRLKITRYLPIGMFAWDASVPNDDARNNDWSQADLMKVLNGGYEAESIGNSLYYDRTSGQAYKAYDNVSSYDFTTTGLTPASKNMIENVKWYLGGGNSANMKNTYDVERGSAVDADNATTWYGQVGLIYLSDFQYASTCGNDSSVQKWYSMSDYCSSSNWLQDDYTTTVGNPYNTPTIDHYSPTSYAILNVSGSMGSTSTGRYINPALYLKSNVYISSGTGTVADPYVLAIPS